MWRTSLRGVGPYLRVLVRPSSRLENLRGLAAETVTGDLLQVDALRNAIAGCDAVMHVAADYRLWVTDPQKNARDQCDGNA